MLGFSLYHQKPPVVTCAVRTTFIRNKNSMVNTKDDFKGQGERGLKKHLYFVASGYNKFFFVLWGGGC